MAKMRNFNPKESISTAIPEGIYTVKMIKSSIKSTPDNEPNPDKWEKARLTCIFQILKGKLKGKTVMLGFNIVNPSPMAADIANRQLGNIAVACGRSKTFDDTDVLHDIPFLLELSVNKATAQFPESNDMVKAKEIESRKIDFDDDDDDDDEDDDEEFDIDDDDDDEDEDEEDDDDDEEDDDDEDEEEKPKKKAPWDD